jgi:pyruvate ferredoxin oxidoreductase gamma subunit
MREILIIGRGGQGAQTAGNLLAQAYFAEGQFVQTFATYGGARRGTPVTSSIRVDDQPIRLRCDIERADAMLCFDDTLLDQGLLGRADDGTKIVVNSTRSSDAFSALGGYQIVAFDGMEIARRNEMGKVVNSALLGAFVAMLDDPGLETMCEVIEQTAPVKQQQNVAACRQAYRQLRNPA